MQATAANIKRRYYVKLRRVSAAKAAVNKMKRQSMKWEKTPENQICDERVNKKYIRNPYKSTANQKLFSQ